MQNLVPRSPRPRIVRPGEREHEPKPIQLTCPLCGEDLGAIVLMDPAWTSKGIQVEVDCLVVEGASGHRELHIKSLDLAMKEDEAAKVEEPAPTN